MKRIILIAVFAVVSFSLTAQDFEYHISIENPIIYPSNRQVEQKLGGLLEEAVSLLREDGIDVSLGGSIGSYRLSSGAKGSKDQIDISLIVQFSDEMDIAILTSLHSTTFNPGEAINIYSDITELPPATIASALNYSAVSALGGFSPQVSSEYELIESVELNELLGLYPGPYNVTGVGLGQVIASGQGDYFIPTSMSLLKMDDHFRVSTLNWTDLHPSLSQYYPREVAIDSEGTIILTPTQGQYLYKVGEFFPEPIRVPTGLNSPGSVKVSDAGVIYAKELVGTRTVQITNNRARDIDFYLSPNAFSYISEPFYDGSLLIYDPVVGAVAMIDDAGTMFRQFFPHLSAVDRGTVASIQAVDRNRIAYFNPTTIFISDLNGTILEKIDLTGLNLSLGGLKLDYSPETDTYAIYDSISTKLFFLGKPESEFHQELTLLQSDLSADPSDLFALEDKARLYSDEEAYAMALIYWRKVKDFDSFNLDASNEIARLEELIVKGNIENNLVRLLDTLENLGPQSAQAQKSTLEQSMEQAQSRFGPTSWLSEVQTALDNAFQQDPGGLQDDGSIRVAQSSLPQIFPSLFTYYAQNDVFEFTIRNGAREEIVVESLSLKLPRYTDAPSEKLVDLSVEARGTVELAMPLVLSQEVQSVSAPVPTVATLEVVYQKGGQRYKHTKRLGTQVQGVNALTWDDTRKLASFITPTDPTIQDFSTALMASKSDYFYNNNVAKAVAAFEGLAQLDLNYVEDPRAPITENLGETSVIDSVKFPSVTLIQKAGDCDDSTALFTSVFESVGVPSALMTSPGHIFFAFDTGDTADSRWMYESDGYRVVEHNGTLWIPLESTNSHTGFAASWRHASGLVERYEGSQDLELIPVAEARQLFNSVVQSSELNRVLINEQSHREQVARSQSTLEQAVSDPILSELTDEAEGQRSRRRAASGFAQAATLAARLGRFVVAEDLVAQALDRDERYLNGYVIEAQLALAQKDPDRALAAIERGLEVRPGASVLLGIQAQTYLDQGRFSDYSDTVAQIPEDTRVLLGLETQQSGARASEAGQSFNFVWIDEEE